jgi:aspartyl-tRNA(Asn)/glutamyl-tRNA(Gln) amidotransferase subunit A
MTRRELLMALLGALALSEVKATRRLGRVEGQEDLTSLTIAQVQARYAARNLTPLQLANAYLARIGTLNKDLNAYVTITRELAVREAKSAKPGTPLYGIPIAHKDLFETRGVRTTAGSLLFEDYIPDTNAAVVQQLEEAGAVLLGKTNTHELGGGVTTINPFFGTTRNPIDRTRIAGGSSGGSAAAVAARLCLAATGSDTGGSVRIPAAFCGVVGFKPTHGLLSTRGLIAASPSFDHVGFLTRTVEDAQLVFQALGPDATDTSASPRIGIPRNYFFDELDPQVATATRNAIAALGPATAIDFPIDATTMARVFDPVFLFELWSRFGADWRTNPGSFSKEFSGVFSIERPSVAEYEAGLAALEEYQAAVDKLFNAVDVIVTPTVPVTAPPIAGRIDGMQILRNTWPFNAAGTPAISIPLPVKPLPVGLQLIARRGDDDKLLQLARSLGTLP